jgi:nucleoside-diphosphate-sugar epimerase
VVTGAAGLIGGVVVDRLRADGHGVVGIDLPHERWMVGGRNVEDEAAPGRVDIHSDLASATAEEWQEMLNGCEVVVHLAADANPSNPDESMMRNNVEVTNSLMRNALAAGVERVVLSSSGLVQVGLEEELEPGGPLSGQLLGVSHGVSTTSTYGESKAHAERLGEHYAREHGMTVVAVRIGTVIPDESLHWEQGGRLQATAFLQADVAEFFSRAVVADLTVWVPNSCPGHPDVPGYLLTAAQSDSPGRFVDLEPGVSALGWVPIPWPAGYDDLH